METIKEMIARMCPKGVKWVKLENICTSITAPKKLKTTEYLPSGPYLIIDQGKNDFAGFTNQHDALLPKGEYILYGDHTCTVKYTKELFAQGADGLKILKINDNIAKYVFYALCVYNIDNTEYKRHWLLAKEIDIPLPPLPIQQEIVRILDSFTSLQYNLEAELTARQKQYEHYRNELLTFDKNDKSVEWKPMGEIGKLVRGNGLQKTDFTEEGIGCIHYGQIYTRLGFSCDKTLTYVSPDLAKSLTKVEPGDIVMACTSENVEDVCKSVVWLGKETIVTGGHACVFKHKENPKYIGYCLLTNDFFNQKRAYAYGAKVIDIKTEKLALIQLPIPSLQRQQEIVNILDTFEATISNLKQEIEARKKQYEYYREQLLTFD